MQIYAIINKKRNAKRAGYAQMAVNVYGIFIIESAEVWEEVCSAKQKAFRVIKESNLKKRSHKSKGIFYI